jgi:hypothetical protein
MNISDTEICNLALSVIGAAPIHNLNDSSERSEAALLCQRFWPIIRLCVFRSHPWNCISASVTLTQTVTPPWGWSYGYVLPDDYVRMNRMEDLQASYRILKGNLYCDANPANIDYVTLETDCAKYSPDLVRALYLNLAYELAYALTHQVDIANNIKADLEKFFLPLARMNDAVEDGVVQVGNDTLTNFFR